MRILIIEDHPKTASFLHKGLTGHSFIVDIAKDGEEAYCMILQSQYDLIILDIMLPRHNGWAILDFVKNNFPKIRIIFLTAQSSLENRVKGLELGADDYLVKPFAFSELLARIRTILRRGTDIKNEELSISNLTIDLIRHKVTRGGKTISLTPKEFALLVFLVQQKEQVVTRTLIAEKVWDIHFDTNTNVIDVLIKRLRQKIDLPFEKKLLHTVRGIGYVISIN